MAHWVWACWGWVYTQLRSLLTIWALEKEKLEVVAAKTQEGMSQEEGKIAHMHFAGGASKNRAFSAATQLSCCRVREGSRTVGANVLSLASLPRAESCVVPFLHEWAK